MKFFEARIHLALANILSHPHSNKSSGMSVAHCPFNTNI